MRVKVFSLFLAITATTAQPVLAGAGDVCFTRDETKLALSYLTPMLIEGVVTACTPHMAQNSVLLQQGPTMAANYRAVANPTDADAEALFRKIGGVTDDAPPALPMAALRDEIFNGIAPDIEAEDCKMAERFVGDLAALPAANVLGLIETVILTAERDKREKKARRTKKPIAPSVFCEG